jgi:CRISPR-associated protein Cst1
MERVYLGDWLYNAGIIGFINIMLDGKDLNNQNIIKIGDNYIEFDRSSLSGFAEKFFKAAYGKDKRIESTTLALQEIYDKVSTGAKGAEKEIKEFLRLYEKRILKEILDNKQEKREKKIEGQKRRSQKRMLSFLVKVEEKLTTEQSLEKQLKYMKIAIKFLRKYETELAQYCVGKILSSYGYGQRGFLNGQFVGSPLDSFKSEYEDPVVNQSNSYSSTHTCIFCGLRPAKKNSKGEIAGLDTGIIRFYGANKDKINLFWNCKIFLPICDICELIYFSVFAGLTKSEDGRKLYFVNKDESVSELYTANRLLMQLMAKDNILKERGILDFLHGYVLWKLKEKSKYSLGNISFIETDLADLSSKKPIKVYGFNIPERKALFILSNYDDLRQLPNTDLPAGSKRISASNSFMHSFMHGILNDTQNYSFLEKLERFYIDSLKSNADMKDLTPKKMQLYNKVLYEYLKIFKQGGVGMDSRQLDQMYSAGRAVGEALYACARENDPLTLSYRLTSTLRIGDVNTFMYLVTRTYMSLGMKMPPLFVQCFRNRNDFYALGYSFVNGLLEKWGSARGQ